MADIVSSYRSAATELRATNDSLLSASVNEVMKTLTLIAFLTSPLTVLAGFFGMNVTTPFEGTPEGFWFIISLGVLISLSMYLYFRFKRWF